MPLIQINLLDSDVRLIVDNLKRTAQDCDRFDGRFDLLRLSCKLESALEKQGKQTNEDKGPTIHRSTELGQCDLD
jgi:hypothetical protein